VRDSQAAVPLMKRSSARVDYLYDVMDPAYDAELIDQMSVPLTNFWLTWLTSFDQFRPILQKAQMATWY
jgi:hypothetical protein